jgi:hypothetical protein
MAKLNKYGRQVFLSREEIRLLRELVGSALLTARENMAEAEDFESTAEYIEGFQKEIDLCKRLIGNEEPGDNGKLWYYVDPSEGRI